MYSARFSIIFFKRTCQWQILSLFSLCSNSIGYWLNSSSTQLQIQDVKAKRTKRRKEKQRKKKRKYRTITSSTPMSLNFFWMLRLVFWLYPKVWSPFTMFSAFFQWHGIEPFNPFHVISFNETQICKQFDNAINLRLL